MRGDVVRISRVIRAHPPLALGGQGDCRLVLGVGGVVRRFGSHGLLVHVTVGAVGLLLVAVALDRDRIGSGGVLGFEMMNRSSVWSIGITSIGSS